MNFKLSQIFIRNNNTRNKPKKTEILNLLDTFITQQKEKNQPIFLIKSNSLLSTKKSDYKINSVLFSYLFKKKISKNYSNIDSINENSISRSTQADNFKILLNRE